MKRRKRTPKKNKGGKFRERVKALLIGDSFNVEAHRDGVLARYAAKMLRYVVRVRKADFGDGWTVVRIK